MSSYVEGEGDSGSLVEPEGVNAGGPVDRGPGPADVGESAGAAHDGEGADETGRPSRVAHGQGKGELLSRAGSDNGLTHPGPGQEFSAGEG